MEGETTASYPGALCVWLILSAHALLAQGPSPNVNDGNALQRECGAALQAQEDRVVHPNRPDDDDAGFDTGQCLGLVSAVWHTHMLMVEDRGRDGVLSVAHDQCGTDGPARHAVLEGASRRA